MMHVLKSWPEPFGAVVDGRKKFEFRRSDRAGAFAVGDMLRLREWVPHHEIALHGHFTGRIQDVRVTHISHGGSFDIPEGFVIMSIFRVF